MDKNIKNSKYKPEIDGLRAFAIIAVIINHFDKKILPGGYLGVDIFFVISGYIITSSLIGKPKMDFLNFICGFYERRIKRLIPTLTVFVLIMSLIVCMINPDPKQSLFTGISSLFGLSNIFLYRNATDYFANSAELNPFTQTWSLGIEEQFYILFPFFVWFSGYALNKQKGVRNLFISMGTLSIASLFIFRYLYPQNQPAAYFLISSRFWEIAIGCLTFVLIQKRPSIKKIIEKVPSFLFLGLIFLIMLLPMQWASSATVGISLLTTALIVSFKKNSIVYKTLTHPKVVYIGLISYPLYLWHWGIISISRWTIGIHWWSIPMQIGIIFLISQISYNYIEIPFRYSLTKNYARWLIFCLGSASVIFTSIISFLFYKGNFRIFLGDKKNSQDLLVSNYKIEGTGINWENCSSVKNQFVNCSWKDESSQYHYFLVGDSHAAHLLPMLSQIKKENGGSFFAAISGGKLFPSGRADVRFQSLKKNLQNSANSKKVILLANDWSNYGESLSGNKFRYDFSLLNSISKENRATLIIVNQIPVFKGKTYYATACSKEFYRPFPPKDCPKNLTFDYKKFEKGRFLVSKNFSKLVNNKLRVFSPHETICVSNNKKNPELSCKTVLNNELIYIDGSHLSSIGSRYLTDAFNNFVQLSK